VHIGESFSSGHFISKLKNLVTEDWQLFDDARIRMLDPDDVKVALKLSLHWLIIDSHIWLSFLQIFLDLKIQNYLNSSITQQKFLNITSSIYSQGKK